MLGSARADNTTNTSLGDDKLVGVAAIAAFTGDSERRIRNQIEAADRALEAGLPDDGSRFPFTRRGGLLISFKTWLIPWYRGERVQVSRGDPKVARGGRPRKAKALEPEPEPVRISARTGRPVRAYRRRAPDSHQGT